MILAASYKNSASFLVSMNNFFLVQHFSLFLLHVSATSNLLREVMPLRYI